MENVIQIRHGSSVPTTTELSHGYELGFSTTTGSLYINNGSSAISRLGIKTLSGTAAPSSGSGEDGDLYVQYTTSGNTTTINALFIKLASTWVEVSTGGGAAVLMGTSAPTSAQGENGNLYVQYHVSGNDSVVDALFVKISGAWCQISTGGGGGSETVLTSTLTAGSTSLTFTNAAITTTATYRVGTTDITVRPTGATVAAGSLTLTFASQASDLGVKVVIY